MILLDDHSPAHIRKNFGATQAEMADAMGMSLRGYEELEAGRVSLRKVHRLAAYAAAIDLALSKDNVAALPPDLKDSMVVLIQRILEEDERQE